MMNCKWLIPFLLLAPISMVQGQPAPDIPSLTVTGYSQFSVPADELQLRIGAAATATELAKARGDVDDRMRAVVSALNTLGLKAGDDYKTSRYDVSPQWSPRPRRGETQDWVPKLLGYTVQASVQVKTSKLELAGSIIERSVTAGANDIGAAQFTLSDPRTARAEAITTAAKNAIKDANTLAAATHARLGRILDMNIGNSGYVPMPRGRSGMMAMAGSAESAPVMAPGRVEVTASVTIVYEIESSTTPGDNGQE